MKTNTSDKIIEYIATNGQVRPHDIGKAVNIGQVAIHRHLKKLINEKNFGKLGSRHLCFMF